MRPEREGSAQVDPNVLEAESSRLSKAIVDAQETLRALNLPVTASVRIGGETPVVLHWCRWYEADRQFSLAIQSDEGPEQQRFRLLVDCDGAMKAIAANHLKALHEEIVKQSMTTVEQVRAGADAAQDFVAWIKAHQLR